ncbi:MAG TPA: type II toxin-antitoxin system RelE/ParE family toxin [Terriglobales bacterium]|nr:type II toxin-antitoxin system RelE/ParE family toxin [Terriglobales bacterium]
MIRSFRDPRAERLFKLDRVRDFQAFERPAQRKLAMPHAARALDDLAASPGNRLEKLGGDRAGRHSIRIHDQWRICFLWRDGNAYEVEIVDYH